MAGDFEDPLRQVYDDCIALHWDRFKDDVQPALLCIDLQYLDAARGQGIFKGVPERAQEYYFKRLEQTILPNVERLQAAFRAAGHEVIHVRVQSLTRDGRARSLAHKRLGLLAPPGSRDARFLERVAPRGDEIVINKTASGVFESTNLLYVLRNLGINALLVAGVYTNECVSTTVRVAADLGFYVSLAEDACTTVTPELHSQAVATLRGRYARILDTETAIEDIKSLALRPGSGSGGEKRPNPFTRSSPALCRTVLLLGGNAFAPSENELTMEGQFQYARRAIDKLLPMLKSDREIVVVHGNGPQIGNMLTRVRESQGDAYSLPLDVCVAESAGELGYVIQQTLLNAFRQRGIERPVVSLLTQTLVDPRDPAFSRPDKPVGPVSTKSQGADASDAPSQERQRHLVPSPAPLEILELGVLQGLLHMGAIVVAAGGGGMPVIRRPDGSLKGVEAVVDKDLAGSLLARSLGADQLLMLTAVPCVYTDFGKETQQRLSRASPEQARELADKGQFGCGTMAPKVEAACQFAESGGQSIICSVDSLTEALEGRSGTWIMAV